MFGHPSVSSSTACVRPGRASRRSISMPVSSPSQRLVRPPGLSSFMRRSASRLPVDDMAVSGMITVARSE